MSLQADGAIVIGVGYMVVVNIAVHLSHGGCEIN